MRRLLQLNISGSEKAGGCRPLTDLSRLNWYILTPHFIMETTDSVRLALPKNERLCNFNGLEGCKLPYIPIHLRSRRYHPFHFMGRTHQFRALQFGISPAPYVFTRAVKHCHQIGMCLHAYLDDWLQPLTSQSWSLHQQEQ